MKLQFGKERFILLCILKLFTNIVDLLLDCHTGNPSRKVGGICSFYLFIYFQFLFIFFSVLVKVLPVTPLVSGVFVHRAFCAYFRGIEGVVEIRRFLWWTQ